MINQPQQVLPLWPAGAVPGALGTDDTDIPAITIYSPPAGKNNGAAVVICPGGGYGHLAPHEGEPVARWLNDLGATGVVLRYRLGPRYRHPVISGDAARALRTVRARAAEWEIDPNRIGVLGFSAGGHLAATASVYFDAGDAASTDPVERVSSRPDVSILLYPVISMKDFGHAGSRRNLLGDEPDPALLAALSLETRVTPHTPPTFLAHAADDEPVPIENSLRYALALHAARVPFALSVCETGGHGFGMGRGGDPVTSAWPDACALWLRSRGFFNRTV